MLVIFKFYFYNINNVDHLTFFTLISQWILHRSVSTHLSSHLWAHLPHFSVGRYFPVQSECSPAPGREYSECSQLPEALRPSPPAKWQCREWMNVNETEQEVTACRVTVYLAVQMLYLLSATVWLVLRLAVNSGEKQLGISQKGMSPLQVSP